MLSPTFLAKLLCSARDFFSESTSLSFFSSVLHTLSRSDFCDASFSSMTLSCSAFSARSKDWYFSHSCFICSASLRYSFTSPSSDSISALLTFAASSLSLSKPSRDVSSWLSSAEHWLIWPSISSMSAESLSISFVFDLSSTALPSASEMSSLCSLSAFSHFTISTLSLASCVNHASLRSSDSLSSFSVDLRSAFTSSRVRLPLLPSSIGPNALMSVSKLSMLVQSCCAGMATSVNRSWTNAASSSDFCLTSLSTLIAFSDPAFDLCRVPSLVFASATLVSVISRCSR
mmetsp:Transcript_9593/g.24629  ORF Transcript_9593/g.24629 Transcript_9593/m.24629 type:complete len:288 (-) Transcript_9593:851-1714(-)